MNFHDAARYFAFNIFQQSYTAQPNQNSSLSPNAIQSALAILFLQANPEAADEMRQLLGLSQNTEKVAMDLEAFVMNFNDAYLGVASNLVYSKDIDFRTDLLETLRRWYKMSPEAVDFSQGQQVLDCAKAWTNKVTNGQIKRCLKPKKVYKGESMILLSTFTMKASWKLPYIKESSGKVKFHYENGDHEIEMMNIRDWFSYAKCDGFHFVEIPYANNTDLEMLVIMPLDGQPLKQIIPKLTASWYRDLQSIMGSRKLNLHLPKFFINAQVPIKTILEGMNVPEMFKPGAFNVSTTTPAQLTDIRQCVRLEFKELAKKCSDGNNPREIICKKSEFLVDRPFVYLIRKQSTKDIIFIGHYSYYETVATVTTPVQAQAAK
ncbi:ovalbumin-like [Uranotaenia lowii]|uniref:ovalbumin-like n=1 Tax=Uranotaenia lowii TaxID=190385 RepID=UPI00247A06E3|nr:ovalbumin-like [Uranotaenia lowii]